MPQSTMPRVKPQKYERQQEYLHPILPVIHDHQAEECDHSIRIIIEIEKQITESRQEKRPWKVLSIGYSVS